MGYSIKVPLLGGMLKIKSTSRLRYEEKYRNKRQVNVFGTWFIWQPKGEPSRPRNKDERDVAES